jgi:sugar-phosphatase
VVVLVQSPSQLLQGKTLLIFDFDGTIADTSPLHAAAFERVFSPLGITVDYPSIAGMKTAEAMLQCAKACGYSLSNQQLIELVSEKQALAREMITSGLEALPGVDHFLRWARQRYRLSLATSGSRGTIMLALGKLGYQDWFDPLVCAEDVGRSKPYPDAFLRVLEITGFSPGNTLVFEDSEAGFVSAMRAGVDYLDVSKIQWTQLISEMRN